MKVFMLFLDIWLLFGSLILGCEEWLDLVGIGLFYNEGEVDIVVDYICVLLVIGNF